MFEIKADSIIDDQGITAKELYAAQKGFENKMRYEMVNASETGKGQILMWNAMKIYFKSSLIIKMIFIKFSLHVFSIAMVKFL